MEQINLNLIPNGVNPVAHCKQYDVGRTFRCNLFEGSSVYTLDGTETVECEVHKPDGNLVTLALSNTGSTYVDVTTTLQMCACSGESLAAIKITSGGVEIGSLNFVLNCERSPLEGGITSDSGIYNLETQVTSLVASEVADQYDSANVVFDAEPTEGHGVGYAVTSEGIASALEPTATIENVSIASFDDGGDGVPVKELIVGIEPVQVSGTPTPSNPLPITGWTDVNITRCGVNLWDEQWEVGNIDNTTGGNVASAITIRAKNHIQVTPDTSYCFHIGSIDVFVKVIFYDADKNVVLVKDGASGGIHKNTVFTTPSNCTSIRFVMASAYGTTYNNDISINYPSTDTTYHAGASTTTTVSLGQTVYGGELNVTTGELKITHAKTTYDGSEAWGIYGSGTTHVCFTIDPSNKEIGSNLSICDSFENISASWVADNVYGVFSDHVSINRLYFRPPDASVTTLTDWTTWLGNNNVTVVYPLATPTTVSLTPTEVATVLGYNNIYGNAGNVVSVTYIKDFASATYPIVSTKIGDLADLTTTDKSSVVNAINELDADKVDMIPSGYQTIYGTWSPAINGECYLSCLYFPSSSLPDFAGYYSTDGTTWVENTTDIVLSHNGYVLTVYTTNTACAGCVAKLMLTIS